MEECPVCKHGMLMIERTILGVLIFQCPNCLYMKSSTQSSNSKSSQAKKPCLYGVSQYTKTTTNRVKGVVSKKGGR